jgi:hypothetical protein
MVTDLCIPLIGHWNHQHKGALIQIIVQAYESTILLTIAYFLAMAIRKMADDNANYLPPVRYPPLSLVDL